MPAYTNLCNVNGFSFTASIIPGSLALAASYGGCNESLAISLMILTISVQGFDTVGMNISAYDLAPNYVAPLASIVHTVHSAASFCAPYTIGLLTPHVSTLSKYPFWICIR